MEFDGQNQTEARVEWLKMDFTHYITNILGGLKFSLYSRRVELKYWDNPIFIGERERF